MNTVVKESKKQGDMVAIMIFAHFLFLKRRIIICGSRNEKKMYLVAVFYIVTRSIYREIEKKIRVGCDQKFQLAIR
jgi:hypothetical protein